MANYGTKDCNLHNLTKFIAFPAKFNQQTPCLPYESMESLSQLLNESHRAYQSAVSCVIVMLLWILDSMPDYLVTFKISGFGEKF